jgi:hypothetical protein
MSQEVVGGLNNNNNNHHHELYHPQVGSGEAEVGFSWIHKACHVASAEYYSGNFALLSHRQSKHESPV